MEYLIKVKYDSKVNKWIANNDILPISAKAGSFIELKDIVTSMAQEMVGLNNLPEVETIHFIFENVRETLG